MADQPKIHPGGSRQQSSRTLGASKVNLSNGESASTSKGASKKAQKRKQKTANGVAASNKKVKSVVNGKVSKRKPANKSPLSRKTVTDTRTKKVSPSRSRKTSSGTSVSTLSSASEPPQDRPSVIRTTADCQPGPSTSDPDPPPRGTERRSSLRSNTAYSCNPGIPYYEAGWSKLPAHRSLKGSVSAASLHSNRTETRDTPTRDHVTRLSLDARRPPTLTRPTSLVARAVRSVVPKKRPKAQELLAAVSGSEDKDRAGKRAKVSASSQPQAAAASTSRTRSKGHGSSATKPKTSTTGSCASSRSRRTSVIKNIRSTRGLAMSTEDLNSNTTGGATADADENHTAGGSEMNGAGLLAYPFMTSGPAGGAAQLAVPGSSAALDTGQGLGGLAGASWVAPPTSQGNMFAMMFGSATGGDTGAGAHAQSSSADAPLPPGGEQPDDADMGRLQALLESRGLPSHLFGALGPRMHQLLHRSMGGGAMTKAQQLLQGLQASGDEGQQLTAVIEMCQLLVMGNEDTLAGFPVKQVVPALITLLQMEHNFDMMHHACRALTYMMEALPRSSAVVVEAVPVFLEKLQSIQCMDVAEQALSALEMLSKRHSKALLQAGGIASCLTFLDFFSLSAQRSALAVAANCCQHMNADEFQYVRDSLQNLSARLTHSDRKSVESVALCFARLVDNFQADQRVLKEIAAHGLLQNVQQLLVVSPPVLSSGMFVTVIRMLVLMCANCPDLAVVLLKQNMADTLCYLLVGTSEPPAPGQQVELMSRSPQESYELVSLIGELMPRLPGDGIFSVDALLRRSTGVNTDPVIWQWRDDRGLWHPYSLIDSRVVETAHQASEDDVSLSTLGRMYTIDFNSMQQINEDTGTARPVQRKANPLAQLAQNSGASCTAGKTDSRAENLKENAHLAAGFVKALFAVLYEVYSSSAGPAVRHQCMHALLRMIYYSEDTLLREILENISVSSHIAAMMASQDLKIVVRSMQMACILMEKLPDIFSVFFRREGVMHQIERLCDLPLDPSPVVTRRHVTSSVTSSAADSPDVASLSPVSSTSSSSTSSSPDKVTDKVSEQTAEGATCQTATPSSGEDKDASSSQTRRFSDVLKRKKPPKRSSARKGSRQEESPEPGAAARGASTPTSSARNTPFLRAKTGSSRGEPRSVASSMKSSLLASLNPSRWGRSSASSAPERPPPPRSPAEHIRPIVKMPAYSPSPSNKEKVRAWVRKQAQTFNGQHFSSTAGVSHPALHVLNRLSAATEQLLDKDSTTALQQIAQIVKESDVSPFEVIHSGLVGKLLAYLTPDDLDLRDLHIRVFLHVFQGLPAPPVRHVQQVVGPQPPPAAALVTKLRDCLHHLEQFQVKVHDLPGASQPAGGPRHGSSALKFFNSHQLKCHLQRHPDCKTLRQWKGGPVKIDPLALTQAIERYLVLRGYGRVRQDPDEGDSEEGDSDEDIDDTMAAVSISQGTAKHRLEFLIGDKLLPYNMTVYQAVRTFSQGTLEGSETDTDTEHPFGSASVWVQTHTIWYRPAPEEGGADAGSAKKTRAERPKHSRKRTDELWVEGATPAPQWPLEALLSPTLPPAVTVRDPALPVLALMRILHGLNVHWPYLYETSLNHPVLSSAEFVSSKLTAKANRQLQDPLVIMTGNLPQWLGEVGYACPFVLPFDTRQLLFYTVAFDRDRAMQKLQDSSAQEPQPAEQSERVTPRLDRKKRMVSRGDLLKQGEKIMEEMANSRSMLEIQYENEVGTGLGPTLEFYALLSRELQRADLDMWRGEPVKMADTKSGHAEVTYMFSPCGLFPAPFGRHTKTSVINKVKAKFKLLGKVMAKAILDSRMLDIPLSAALYTWLQGSEKTLCAADLRHVDPVLANSFYQLDELLRQKNRIEHDPAHTAESRRLAIESLTLDGCTVDDLGLDFVLPGYSNIELMKGGKDMPVTLDNLEEYLKLVVHWTLVEGVQKQLEALREGFDSVFSRAHLNLFYPHELEQVVCGAHQERWDARQLVEVIHPDHGYTLDSPAVRHLVDILSAYTPQEQRSFLQFVTGSPRLPVGGLRALSPSLTIVRKTLDPEENPDHYLPSVMTCVNYLKLPDYSTREVMREKLSLAAREGQLSFHLS